MAQLARPPVARVALLGLAPLALRRPRCADSRGFGEVATTPRGVARALDGAAGLDVDAALGGVVLEVARVQRRSPPSTSTMAFATLRIRYRSWVISTIVPPKAFSASSSTSRDWMSRWFVGSSRQSRFAGSARSLASARPRLLAAGEDADLLLDRVAAEQEGAEQLADISAVDIIGAASLSSSNTVLAGLRASIWCCAK